MPNTIRSALNAIAIGIYTSLRSLVISRSKALIQSFVASFIQFFGVFMNTNFGIELSDDSAQNVSGGISGRASLDVFKNSYINVYTNKYVSSYADPKGNLADAEAYADASGPNSLAETLTLSSSNPFGSNAYSGSTSASN
jgi:hypothetical protein